MRVSVVALSALTALSAHELIRNDAVTPSEAPSTAKAGDKNAAQSISTTQPQLPQAIAQPETLSSQKSVESAGGDKPSMQKTLALNVTSNLGKAIDLPPPPKIATTPVMARSLSVDQLPIEAIIADTVRAPGQKTPTVANGSSKAGKAAAKRPSKLSVQFADVQGHPAQEAILALAQKGVIKGFSDGTFRPDRLVTDSEFKSMMRKGLQKSQKSVEALDTPADVVSRADAAQFVYQKMLAARPDATVAGANSKLPQIEAIKVASSNPAQAYKPQLPRLFPGTVPNQLPTTSLPPTSQLSAASSLDESYTLGAGDKIKVDVFNVPEYSKDYQVLVNGTLNLFRIGNVSVEGMTLKQAEGVIAAKYARLVKRSLVDVSLTTPRPLNVAVAGEIGRPGSYTLSLTDGGKFPTITRLIQQAGGMTQSANPRQVTLTRQQRSGAEQVININLWELFQTGNLKQDITLRDGDSILVAPKTEFDLAESSQLAAANFAADSSQPLNIAVVGEVNRPGPYVLSSRGQSGQSGQEAPAKTGGGLPTITQAIQQAGGITQLADIRKIEVRRATRSGQSQSIQINLWQLLNKGDLSQDLVLQQGDTISIPIATAINTAEASQLGLASFAPGSVRINVVGEVARPGTVEVQPNTPLNQALLAAGGFNKDAKKSSIELIRLNPNGTVVRQTIEVDLAKGIDDKTNPIVRSNDIIVVSRSGAAKFSDTLDRVLGPVGKVLPFRFLFGF